MPNSLTTIADFIRFAYSRFNEENIFFGHGTDNGWDESVSLVLQVLYLPWDFSTEMWSCRLSEEEKSRVLEAISLRVDKRIPLAYITKQAWFCDHRFIVDERVLIPRSPIAELINNRFSPWLFVDDTDKALSILDLCTGSGCIGIAAALEFDNAKVDLLDISEDALAVAKSNIALYELENRVTALQSDVFSVLKSLPGKRYDIILSNPPYVDLHDYQTMPEEFAKEPELGLVAGEDGLDIVRKILSQAAQYLTDEGLMIVEVGNSWEALEKAYPDFPFMWVEFEFGGHGVFVIRADELKNRSW